jgi:hypothetical protein
MVSLERDATASENRMQQNITSTGQRDRYLLPLLLLLRLALGVWYSVTIPLWEAYDELDTISMLIILRIWFFVEGR